MLLEAIEQIRSAERIAERTRQAAREKKKELLRAAHQEGERRLEILRQELEETRQEQERLLHQRLKHEESAVQKETERLCAQLQKTGEAHMVQAVRLIAREVADGWQS